MDDAEVSRFRSAVEYKAKPLAFDIVDADAHVNPPNDFWVDYLPEKFRDVAPKVEHAADADYIIFEGNRRKMNLLGAQAGRSGKDFKVEGRRSDMRSGGWMPAARIADMDQDGMGVAVLFGGGPLGSKNVDLYIESFAAYNRWLSDFCSYDSRSAGRRRLRAHARRSGSRFG